MNNPIPTFTGNNLDVRFVYEHEVVIFNLQELNQRDYTIQEELELTIHSPAFYCTLLALHLCLLCGGLHNLINCG
jgi:hypothetical protein